MPSAPTIRLRRRYSPSATTGCLALRLGVGRTAASRISRRFGRLVRNAAGRWIGFRRAATTFFLVSEQRTVADARFRQDELHARCGLLVSGDFGDDRAYLLVARHH